MKDEELLDRVRLARTDGIGSIIWQRLIARYGSATAAIAALPGLARAGGRAHPPAVPSRARAEAELERLAKIGAHMLVLDGPDYPPQLAHLADPPPALAVLGALESLRTPTVAIVGARNASANGQRIAEELAGELAAPGLTVVSGMARGVDAAAHKGALATGRTIAAVAGGLDMPYPPEHRALQARIAERGAVVAEAPLGTAPQARHFPRRNRIIAGLSLGVVVVEAALRSGSLITARFALEAGRELFAVPGSPLDPRTRGSNDLIRQGAHLVETASDVLEHLSQHLSGPLPLGPSSGPPATLSAVPKARLGNNGPAAPETSSSGADDPGTLPEARRQVLELLDSSPTTVDDLVRRCQFSAAAVNAVLLELEIAGRVVLLPGDRVMRTGSGD
ncbi:MAG TPA: DNA-processing protein DprA [Acetobacteraceae bacterium]|nr:DNA-processing protein DprA [Acetobacteraceae bacterium]